ncbi:MAG TPA: DUF547 domain-containing protein [Burkholderiales bacterium]|nr:DUF547 domain-containing protein [Burkholderiales bacterium]
MGNRENQATGMRITHYSLLITLLGLLALPVGSAHAQFDHEHKAWTALLKKHVVLIDGGKASRLRYAGMQRDHALLKAYLDALSAVSEREFGDWTKPRQLAFLINAYNAFAVEKVLTRYPDIRSVWDFGKIFGNPFKDRFFTLLGRKFSLDMIEHDTIRAKGVYDEPRIHFAVNCASVGCPMLREEAYIAERLDGQLEEQTRRFLADRTRNRFNSADNTLEVSEIFKWYSTDFTSGLKGIRSREQFLGKYADLLADGPADRKVIREQRAEIHYLDYDWSLNDAKTAKGAP